MQFLLTSVKNRKYCKSEMFIYFFRCSLVSRNLEYDAAVFVQINFIFHHLEFFFVVELKLALIWVHPIYFIYTNGV